MEWELHSLFEDVEEEMGRVLDCEPNEARSKGLLYFV